MTANESKPGSGQESSGESSTTRRTFLGAAAALAALPATAEATGASEGSEAAGAHQFSIGDHSDIWTSFELGEVLDEDAAISVAAYHYADGDEPHQVEMTMRGAWGSFWWNLTPTQALELSADLQHAAIRARAGP